MNNMVDSISKCLSLRTPQTEALKLLAGSLEKLHEKGLLKKNSDIAAQLSLIQEYQREKHLKPIEGFDRSFCSLTFDIATGVGKTRLMGAFIAYLYKTFGFKNYLIVAPGTTIYEKLRADFTPSMGNSKYVFRGLTPIDWPAHKLVTGDDYNRISSTADFFDEIMPITINILNIGKFIEKQSSKENHLDKNDENANVPRIRRVSELLGDSYFNILSKKEDLVIIMDEAHHYRAEAGGKAIEDLNPVLGIELTATPKDDTKNILYSYGLPEAMRDGFVKIPAVAYRSNLDVSQFSDEDFDHYKLKEAEFIHRNKKAALNSYAFNLGGNNKPVKPFIFVITKSIEHASQIEEYMQSSAFCDGAYKGKVLRIDSSSKDEDIRKLLTVENPLNPCEVVIHCNKLGEGWDVTNLYTIVPLRAANSMQLILQSIGRGLRLPYGKQVGDEDIDNVVVISHDNFNKVIKAARDKMLVVKEIDLGASLDATENVGTPDYSQKKEIVMKPTVSRYTDRDSMVVPTGNASEVGVVAGKIVSRLDVDADQGKKPNLEDSSYVEQTKADLEKERIAPAVIEKAIETVKKETINIPRIKLQPVYNITCNIDSFEFDSTPIKQLQPVDNTIIMKDFLSNSAKRYISRLESEGENFDEIDFMGHLMEEISEVSGIDYDSNVKKISDIVNQVKDIIKQSSRPANIVVNYFRQICDIVSRQLLAHRIVGDLSYNEIVEPGYVRLLPIGGTMATCETYRYFKESVADKVHIKSMAFNGFKKCLYDVQKFDSDPERHLMAELEDDETVLKWFRATQTTFSISYGVNGACYTPDIVIETMAEKILCEVKSEKDMTDSIVLQKADAGSTWCEKASKNDSKPWVYVLISEKEIEKRPNLDINGLKAFGKYTKRNL